MREKAQALKNRLKNQKGFTLIELMATLVILAIIVAIAVPAVGNITAKAKQQSYTSHIAMIENAGELADIAGLQPDLGTQRMVDSPMPTEGEDPMKYEENVYSVGYLIDEGFLKMDFDDTGAKFGEFYAKEESYRDIPNIVMVVREDLSKGNGQYKFQFIETLPDQQ